jgi:hypothetical protein
MFSRKQEQGILLEAFSASLFLGAFSESSRMKATSP